MATETKDEKAERMIAEMKAARGYLYPSHELAVRLDPDFMEAYNKVAGLSLLHEGVELDGRALAPKYRELIAIGMLLARGGSPVSHMRRAIQLGATEAELLETAETAFIPGGAPAFLSGLSALQQIRDEIAAGKLAAQE